MVRHNEKTVQSVSDLKATIESLKKLEQRVNSCVSKMDAKKLGSVFVTHDASLRSGIDRVSRFVAALEKEVERAVVPPPPPKPAPLMRKLQWYCVPGQQPVWFDESKPIPPGALVWFNDSTNWEAPPPPAPPKQTKK